MTMEVVWGSVPLKRCWVLSTVAATWASQVFFSEAVFVQPAVGAIGFASRRRHFLASGSSAPGAGVGDGPIGAGATTGAGVPAGRHAAPFRMRISAESIVK